MGESVENPGKYYRNNVAGSLTLLEAVRDHKIPYCIFSSTCATYGIPQELPLREDHPQQPISPYGASKLMIERILQDFENAHGLRFMSLRYFNISGADPDGEIGESHEIEAHLIPIIMDVALGKRQNITIYGDDYSTPYGACIRDYIHVTDLAQAHVLALRALEQGSPSMALNLGNGQGFSVREVIDLATQVTGRPITATVGPRRAGDPPRLVADATTCHRVLGWEPAHAALEDILATAWTWHQKRPSVG